MINIQKYCSNDVLKLIFSLLSIKSYKSFIINHNIFIFFCFSLIYYFKGLKGCELEEQECLIIYDFIFYANLILETVKSSILIIIIIFLILHNYASKFHFIYIIPTYIIIFLKYNGSNLKDHGLYNSIAFILLIIIGLTIIYYIYFICYFYKKKKLYHLC